MHFSKNLQCTHMRKAYVSYLLLFFLKWAVKSRGEKGRHLRDNSWTYWRACSRRQGNTHTGPSSLILADANQPHAA